MKAALDGEQCHAPAIKGGTVCLRYGGAALQVRIAAGHMVLLERAYEAWLGGGAGREGHQALA